MYARVQNAAPNKDLFTSRVFEGMREDYFVSRNFPDRLFTSPGFEGIIPRYPSNPLPSSVFLTRLKTFHHGRVFFEEEYLREFESIG
jgi:hypothetical protein